MPTLQLRGLLPAFPTPLAEAGGVDIPALRTLVSYMLEQGASGLVPLGGTGEYTALSHRARIQVIEQTVAVAAGRVPVVAGVLSPGLNDAIEAGKAFHQAGADALMVIAPYYAKNTQAGVLHYLREVRAAVELPIVLYDNQARSHFVIQPDTIGILAEGTVVVGMKASNTDLYHFEQVMQCVGADFQMLSGQDTLFAQQVAMGARGGVLTSAVLLPGVWNEVQRLAEADRFRETRGLQRTLCPLMDALFAEETPVPLRAALAMLGMPCGRSLAPLLPMFAALGTRLLSVLNALHQSGALPLAPAPLR
ncbi:dihydrodipicolinate synthase family protein [Pseudomonas typographi]|uniref:dihydrodipicolinate synthase family protein n=1 Tax=Pseudomonas typographi TaxID=2715964 RepID=UPI0016866344|nr:dihydrodipicolinate synthase family protein [Pseudomonas typographi]MBD1586341.1 dihydrodipicolinate synthase family protein [Pseudomonas typographi]